MKTYPEIVAGEEYEVFGDNEGQSGRIVVDKVYEKRFSISVVKGLEAFTGTHGEHFMAGYNSRFRSWMHPANIRLAEINLNISYDDVMRDLYS